MPLGRLVPLKMLKNVYRGLQNARLARQVGPVRRVDRVAPVPGRRLVALTFDDGPSAAPLRPSLRAGGTVSGTIMDLMKRFGARGTFNVIGTTRFNYPDRPGRLGGVFWSGIRFDHYPEYGRDDWAGVLAQPALARRLVDEGHELSNHGFTHLAFGPSLYGNGSRAYLPGLDAVIADLRTQHELVRETTGFAMRLARPPHYIERTADGRSAYDAYRVLGYTYLGASFDGGGWQASSGDYEADVEMMVRPLAAALAADPEVLNGGILFEKDGYNMSAQSPVADGLKRHLEILRDYGYEVLTASELLALSPFSDIGPAHPIFPQAKALLEAGHLVTFADNHVRPDSRLTQADLEALCVRGASCGALSLATDRGFATPPVLGAAGLLLRFAGSPTGRNLAVAGSATELSARGLAAVCLDYLGSVVLPEDEAARRRALVTGLAARFSGGWALPATRAEVIAMIAATLLGV